MRRIIAGLDIGSYSIKLVVGEFQKNRLNILSCVEVPSQGIKKGYIVNPESALPALREAFDKTEELIGIPVRKVLVSVPCYDLECFMTAGSTTITSENKVIMHNDLIRAMQASVYNKIMDNKELISILPTKFILNDEEQVVTPIGMVANKLTVNDVAVIIPKKNVENIVRCVEKLGIEVIDTCVSPLCDYYQFKNEDTKNEVGAVVNIGQTNTTVSIFNKGIITACEVLDIGAVNVDNDIAYIAKIGKKDARYLKEKMALADIHVAQPSEAVVLKDVSENEIKINQYDVSAVVISRLNEMLNLIKKQINLLTKKEISYIIVTGGLSELKYFDRLLMTVFGNKAKIIKITEIGARHNKYSAALGMIKYYNSRLKLRNVDFSIFSLDEQEDFGGTHRRVNISENSLLGKIYGYFFDN